MDLLRWVSTANSLYGFVYRLPCQPRKVHTQNNPLTAMFFVFGVLTIIASLVNEGRANNKSKSGPQASDKYQTQRAVAPCYRHRTCNDAFGIPDHWWADDSK